LLTADKVRNLPPAERRQFLDRVESDPELAKYIKYNWEFWAREKQLPPPGTWQNHLILAGRGFGKTRTGAEWVRQLAYEGNHSHINLIAQDPHAAIAVMIKGPSGILSVCHPDFRPEFIQSHKLLRWPNGVETRYFVATDPEDLRGPEHAAVWADELCAWKYDEETWDNMGFGLRLKPADGTPPRVLITTTPKPTKLLKKIMNDPYTHITRGSTYDNQANLASGFIRKMRDTYEGTRLGAQELHADVLEEQEGALWNRDMLDKHREPKKENIPHMKTVYVAIDPQTTKDTKRKQFPSETGIVVVGLDGEDRAWVLDDLSFNAAPAEWAAKAIQAYHDYKADAIVYEANQGGEMVLTVLRTSDPNDLIKKEKVFATKGKYTRAEPVSSLYEKGQVRHAGFFADLEDQMCTWTGKNNEPSPDRLDAMVWGITKLLLTKTHRSDISIVPGFGRISSYWKGN